MYLCQVISFIEKYKPKAKNRGSWGLEFEVGGAMVWMFVSLQIHMLTPSHQSDGTEVGLWEGDQIVGM